MTKYRIVARKSIAQKVANAQRSSLIGFDNEMVALYAVSCPVNYEQAGKLHAQLAKDYGNSVSIQPIEL